MFIFASENELNDVAHFFEPKFPEQHLEEIEKECFYVINEVPVTICLIPNGKEGKFADISKTEFKRLEEIIDDEIRKHGSN